MQLCQQVTLQALSKLQIVFDCFVMVQVASPERSSSIRHGADVSPEQAVWTRVEDAGGPPCRCVPSHPPQHLISGHRWQVV